MRQVPSIGIEEYVLVFGWKHLMTLECGREHGRAGKRNSKYGKTGQCRRGNENVLLAFPQGEQFRASWCHLGRAAVDMSRGSTVLICFVSVLTLTACSVGPGTPLIVALKADKSQLNGNVPKPRGYGPPINAGVSSGLINPEDRKETEAYLEALAAQP